MHSLSEAALWDRSIDVFQSDTYYNVGNGCIQRNGDGYVLINRLQNYPTSLGRPPDLRDTQTISYMLWIDLDRHGIIQGSHIIDQDIVYQQSIRPVNRQMIIGVEDTRLFKYGKNWWFVTSTGHFERWEEKEFWGQAIGYLSRDTSQIEWIAHLDYQPRNMIEKNWLPFLYRDEPCILYQSDPLTILRPKSGIITGRYEKFYEGPKLGLPSFRGSAPPIPWNDGYLYMIHEQGKLTDRTTDPPLDSYFYLQRFIELSKTFQITRISPLFCFREHGVEYTCGMCLSHDGKQLLVPYSSANGTDSNLIALAVDTVESLLNATSLSSRTNDRVQQPQLR